MCVIVTTIVFFFFNLCNFSSGESWMICINIAVA